MATFDSLFSNLRELPEKAPRRELLPGLKRPPVSWNIALFAAPFMLFFLVFAFVAIPAMRTGSQYSKRAKAVVLQRENLVNAGNSGANTSGNVFLKYRFRVAGHDVTGNLITSPNDIPNSLGKLQPGQSFLVVYDPVNPSDHIAVARQATEQTFWDVFIPIFLIIPAFIIFMFVPFVLPQMKDWWRARRLYGHGLLAQGHIIFVYEGGSMPNMPNTPSQVVYVFTDQNGVRHDAVQAVTNRWLVGQWHPESPVVVAYDVKKPRRSVILDGFSAARR